MRSSDSPVPPSAAGSPLKAHDDGPRQENSPAAGQAHGHPQAHGPVHTHAQEHAHGYAHTHAQEHEHDHAHGHAHAPAVTHDNERHVLLAFWLIASFMVLEVVGGLVSGSLALLADAGHMATDAAALALAYGAFRFGRRAADSRRTFGYLRLEVLAGFINAVTLFAIVVWILYEAWHRMQTPVVVLAGPMFGVAVAGLVVNLVVLRILTRGDHSHVNIKGAVLHVVGDLLGSVAAVAAAVVIHFTGWTPIDPLLSVLVALLILRSAAGLLVRSVHILLEGAPASAQPDQVAAHLMQTVPGLAAVRHVHVWSMTSGRILATLHVEPLPQANARTVVRAAETALQQRFNIEHVTVALDWPGEQATCSLEPAGRAAPPAAQASGKRHEH